MQTTTNNIRNREFSKTPREKNKGKMIPPKKTHFKTAFMAYIMVRKYFTGRWRLLQDSK